MSGKTISKFFTSKTIENYLEKKGYKLITGRSILTKFFGFDKKKLKDYNIEGLSRKKFVYKTEQELVEINCLFSNLIDKIEIDKSVKNSSIYYKLFISNGRYRLSNFRDVQVFDKLISEVINNEINKYNG